MVSTFLKLEGEEISTSVIIKNVLDFDQEIADIITTVFTNIDDIDRFKQTNPEFDNQWNIGDFFDKPILLKMGGYCKGGFSDSSWAIYLSGIGCLIFDDPLTISDFCNLYLWNNEEDRFIWNASIEENNDLSKIKSLSDSNKNVNAVNIEFNKYQEWDEDTLYVKSNFSEVANQIKLHPYESLKREDEYIFDSDNSFDFDILSEISQIWPLRSCF
ncbi:hypothetical protein HA142_06195 [Prochlorococcus marinus str. XMU1401]|uniref:Uncharacterized protein n=1 Tax=Prochlorococcus marinus str. XMU1401 TaxID=2052594 RepID=A0A8I2BKI0_PROMR|nr:hypothetical protein [Prochlorococcus marinus]MBO8223100.1 hypothetical protein [Prochlorococcus marinus str. XMU1401]MBW3059638.1 hypothetical protein [Prochlorococcus marinus str. XMU1401E]MCQ9197294.1 hypothetical protein [Prochlorococcus marinus XMU1429]